MTIDLCSNAWITMSEITIKCPDYPIGYSGVTLKQKLLLCALFKDVIHHHWKLWFFERFSFMIHSIWLLCLFVCCCLRAFWRAVCFVATEEPDLIGDFTRPFALPLTAGKHQDLKCITPQTLVDLMNGKFKNHVENFTIVDCRYPSFSQINQQKKNTPMKQSSFIFFCKCIYIICKLIWTHFLKI